MKSFLSGLLLLAAAPAISATPVERVVNLLTELKEKLQKDEKVEQKVYDKYACWCENITSHKAAAIEEAQADLRSYGQSILSLKGFVATRISEIQELEAAITANKEAQAQATTIREKENLAFVSETAEMKQAIAALEKAITVLVGAGKSVALVQESTAKAQLQHVISLMPLTRSVSTAKMSLLSEVLEGTSKYMPQSLTVQGILKDMYETFVQDLESSTSTEATANRNFEALIAEKTAQLKADETLKAKKEGEQAEAEQRLADTQALFDDTTAQKEADIEFFDATKAACTAKHEEWTTRSSLRAEELEGIEEAISILSTDDARSLFSSAIKAGKEVGAQDKYDTGRNIAPALVQIRRVTQEDDSSVSKAYEAVTKAAKETRSLRLAALSVEVRSAKVGHFEKVLQAIDSMIQVLKEEDAADIAKRDQCKEEYTSIESTVKDLSWKIEKNDAKIAKLTQLIQLRTEQKAQTIQEIAEVEAHMEAITAQRTADNEAFLKTKEEDQQAIDLLMSAREALSRYYKKNKIDMGKIQGSVKGALLQEPVFDVSAEQAPDADFSDKGHRKGEAKDIVSILTMIIEDLNDEIKNGMKDEEAAQLEYEGMMAAATKLKNELIAKKVSLEQAIAQRDAERTEEIEIKEANQEDLADEISYKKSITPDCDWILRAFEKRAAARTSEMNGLVGAKEFLAGKQEALLETDKKSSKTFDDNALSKVKFLGLRR